MDSVTAAAREAKVSLEDVLDLVDNEDLLLAIAYLEKRENDWQNFLASPAL